MLKPKWSRYLTYGVFALLYLPVASLSSPPLMPLASEQLGWFYFFRYVKFSMSRAFGMPLVNSAIVATYSSMTSTALGVTAALALYRYRSPLQKIHLGLLLAPLVMP